MKEFVKKFFYTRKIENANYPGMFDFAKGYGIILIVIGHVEMMYPQGIAGQLPGCLSTIVGVFQLVVTLGYVTIPMFVFLSGYGFRPSDVKKCIKKQATSLLIPYAISGLCVCTILMIINLIQYKSFIYAAKRVFWVFSGYMIGASRTYVIFGKTISSVGTVWYLVDLFVAWNILNFIFKITNTRIRTVVVLMCPVIGWVVSFWCQPPFCFVQALISVFYLYIGYLAKKCDAFSRKYSPVCLILMLVVAWIGLTTPFAYSDFYIAYGPISFATEAVTVVVYLMIFLLINQYDNSLKNFIGMLGRYSLWIMCLDTVVSQSFPLLWYTMKDRTEAYPVVGLISILLVQVVMISALFIIVYKIDKHIGLKKREAKKARRHANA